MPRFAFYGRTARAAAVTAANIGRCRHIYLIDNTLSCVQAAYGDAGFAEEACFRAKDHLACVRLGDVWSFRVIYIMWNADNSHVVFRLQAMLPMTNGAALVKDRLEAKRRLSNVDAVR